MVGVVAESVGRRHLSPRSARVDGEKERKTTGEQEIPGGRLCVLTAEGVRDTKNVINKTDRAGNCVPKHAKSPRCYYYT